jgi:class 3 adenylate cyclase/predicted ATPase
VPNLAQWLEAHGLAQYSTAFTDNDIDFEVLADLTDGDLEKLGLSLGHRRKLLRALAAQRPIADRHQSTDAAGARPHRSASHDAERRQVTVMFCDLVGSTALANSLDPEDMGALIRRFRDACAAAIIRFDGFVAKFMGDGVLAYFGYPRANEDASEHAVRAAMAIIDALQRIPRPDGRDLQARIGIATGTVMIGDIVGEGSAREHSIVGETPNLAARLQALAEPNAILIGHNTHHLLGRRFDYQPLGEHALKGFATPVPVWRVLREAAAESRFAATRASAAGSIVGRDEELEILLDRWRLAAQGHGRAVLVSGEAGIGKSRLVDTLFARIGDSAWRHLTCQCSPYHTNSALHPVIRHLERAAGFAVDDPDEAKLAKLEAMLRETNESSAAMAIFADLLSLPTDRYAALELSPVQRKGATIAALIDVIKRLAAISPVLLLLEDAHWIDPTTSELWTRLLDAITTSAVLIVVTARPEFASPWPVARVPALELTRLTSAQSADLAAKVAAPRTLGAALIDEIAAKADGVPLFVEELTKGVLESIERPAVPATLQDSLMARLDRLGPAKEIAQVAAVIGQQFSEALLADVMSDSGEELTTGIQQLVNAGLVFHQSRASELTYSFKHALLRDVAYENLLRARRQQIHAKVARALVDHFPAAAESEPELPAYHFAQAGESDLACVYRERAGDRAVARSSFIEAVAHFNAALADAAKLAAGPERARRELTLLLKTGPPLTIIKSGQSADVADLYERARERAAALGDQADLFKATWGLWYNTVTSRRLDRARDHADALVALAESAGDDDLMLEGFHCGWSTAMFRGEIARALASSREGIERYDREKHRWMGPVFGGHDPGVCAYAVHHIALTLAGRPAEARRCSERARALAEQLRHPNSMVHALMNELFSAQMRHEYESVTESSQRLLALADKYNLPPARAHALFLAGWVQACVNDFDAGVTLMEAEYPRASAMGPFFRYYAVLLAEARAKAGRFADALALVRSAIATITEPGVGLHVSELYRLEGLCLLQADASRADEAMRSLQTSLEIARQQGALLLEFNAALTMARTGVAIGDGTRGVASLRALCAALPVGFEAPALADARELVSR